MYLPQCYCDHGQIKSVFTMLLEKARLEYNLWFTATSVWLKRFEVPYSLPNMKISDECSGEGS